MAIHPYENEAEVLQINGLTIENRLDRVSLYGFLDITRDQKGQGQARELYELLGRVIQELDKVQDLPEEITIQGTKTVANPFQEERGSQK